MRRLLVRNVVGSTLSALSLCISVGLSDGSAQERQTLSMFSGCAGDLNTDGAVTLADVNVVRTAIRRETSLAHFDLNSDGRTDYKDARLVHGLFGACRSAADLDNSGTVDGADLGVLLGAYGTVTANTVKFDLVTDGEVDEQDVQFLTAAWGDLPNLSGKSADIDSDGMVTKCDVFLAHPSWGLPAPYGDVNLDGLRDSNDYNFAIGFKSDRGVITRMSNPRVIARCKSGVRKYRK